MKYFRKEEHTLREAVWRMSSEDWIDLEYGHAAFCGFRYFDEQVFREDHLASSASYDN